jgi:hypothetical protein
MSFNRHDWLRAAPATAWLLCLSAARMSLRATRTPGESVDDADRRFAAGCRDLDRVANPSSQGHRRQRKIGRDHHRASSACQPRTLRRGGATAGGHRLQPIGMVNKNDVAVGRLHRRFAVPGAAHERIHELGPLQTSTCPPLSIDMVAEPAKEAGLARGRRAIEDKKAAPGGVADLVDAAYRLSKTRVKDKPPTPFR